MAKKTDDTQVDARGFKEVPLDGLVPGLNELLRIMRPALEELVERGDYCLVNGLENIESMPVVNLKQGVPKPIPGTGSVDLGRMAFRRFPKGMQLAVVCGESPVFYLSLDKLILLVERMHDERRRTVILQNCSESRETEHSKGQILARFNTQHSALHVIWGRGGKAIEGQVDIVKQAVYYIDRNDLLGFYLAAKAQFKGGDELESLLQANEGWREFSIPTNPLDPGAC